MAVDWNSHVSHAGGIITFLLFKMAKKGKIAEVIEPDPGEGRRSSATIKNGGYRRDPAPYYLTHSVIILVELQRFSVQFCDALEQNAIL